MGINHRGLDIAMAQDFLHRSDVVASFEQVSGEGTGKTQYLDGNSV